MKRTGIPETSKYWADDWGPYALITEHERKQYRTWIDSLPAWYYHLFVANADWFLLPAVALIVVSSVVVFWVSL